ncbi:hypothetical protein ZWY2020_038919 [Hordeum vulgare]|nr:hypothetical protein ZWY2020_038919 [Hordeum vulgare]
MAAQSWNPFSCCVRGAAAVDDDYESPSGDKGSPRSPLKSLSSSGTLSPEELSLTLSGSNLHAFTYAELRAATANFSRANYLGCGGFGPVYKGAVDDSLRPGLAAQPVAVKYLDLDCGTQGHQEWLAEVFFLGQLRHKNLVKLIGYCYEDEHRMLVYEFMVAGSLEKHLFKSINGSLPWMTRMKIAVGAAKGLAFLHGADPPVIYRDFKASNILLDSDYNTKLSDFGLAKDGPQGDATHVIDSALECQYSCKGAEVAALVAYKCLSQNPKSRPSMREVVKALEPVLGMDDFFPAGPFVLTIVVEEDKMMDMKVETEEKQQSHHQKHQDRHRHKYPGSAIHGDIVIHGDNGQVAGFTGTLRRQQRTLSYHRERGA